MTTVFLIKDDDTVSDGGGTTTHLVASTPEIAQEYLDAMNANNTNSPFDIQYYVEEADIDYGLDKLREGYKPYHVYKDGDDDPVVSIAWRHWNYLLVNKPTVNSKKDYINRVYYNVILLAKSEEEAINLALSHMIRRDNGNT